MISIVAIACMEYKAVFTSQLPKQEQSSVIAVIYLINNVGISCPVKIIPTIVVLKLHNFTLACS